jgi:ArsR family transcriptional regulator, arsenate/arsenite/antimonite-responsive transcriptional repressor
MTVNTKVVLMAQHKTITVDADVVACCSPIASVEMTEAEASDIAQIFSALSDPVRLRMLSMIASESEVCSCALEGPLAKSQPTISHHTRILAEAGLIIGERRGRWMWWRVAPERLGAIARILGG